jgi:DNA phosphorothioation-associated putative methyltransferase
VHRPAEPLKPAPIVNLGYVINVIEDPQERQDALRRAWSLAENVLIVSARLAADARDIGQTEEFADGYLTSRGTFQKFFEQHELKHWIDQTVEVAALPAGPGVFYVFRSEEARAAFLASRYRRRVAAPRLTRSEEMFNRHRELLQPLMDFVTNRGRLPADDELADAMALREVFGSTRRAFLVVQRVTDKAQWDQIAEERAQDLLMYLALARFDGRPSYSRLPRQLQLDVKGFFSTYNKACEQADALLFSLGNLETVDAACQASGIGKLMPNALYVHESALDHLSPVLRLFEGCARGYVGRVEGANLIKLHRYEPKVSYLTYPDFETDPHPVLAHSLTVHFQTFRVKSRSYRQYRNPPILHRKETFLAPEHPLYAKFARLSRSEENNGLYNDPSQIGTREGWERVLLHRGLRLRGHRLLRGQH